VGRGCGGEVGVDEDGVGGVEGHGEGGSKQRLRWFVDLGMWQGRLKLFRLWMVLRET
jgi:hypothetical protein